MNNLNKFLLESVINEGAKFGQKEVNDILSRSDDFNIGVEYEIRPNMDQRVELENLLKEYGLDTHIDKIIPEHDDMTEVITKKMSLSNGMRHIKMMFKMLTDHKIEVPEMAGMHISISTNKYTLADFNPTKFYLMLNSDYVHSIFPVRGHVSNAANRIKDIIGMNMNYHEQDFYYLDKNLTTKKIKNLENTVKHDIDDKYITANIGEYNMSNGRIELRFFGGEDYHTMYDNIKKQLLRSLFIMELAYTNLFQKEYHKELGRIIIDIKNSDSGKSKDEIEKNRKRLIEAIKDEDTRLVYQLLTYHNLGFDPQKMPPKLFKRITDLMIDKADNQTSLFYAEIVNKHIPEIAEKIKDDPDAASAYAIRITQERFEEAEEAILSDEDSAGRYIHSFFKDKRLPENLEKILANNDNTFPWTLYVKNLKNNGILESKEDFLSLPEVNIDAIIKSLRTASDLAVSGMIKYHVINENNLNRLLRTYVSMPSNDNIDEGNILKVLYEMKEFHGEDNLRIDDEYIRIGLLKKTYHFSNFLGELNTDEKMAYVDSFIDSLKAFTDESTIANRFANVLVNKPDNDLTKDLSPIDDEFISAYRKKYGVDIRNVKDDENE